MMRALWSAASGMIAQQTNVDTISHNLANVNTTGYKTQRAEFKTLLYQNMQTRTTTANGENKPVEAQVGLGTRVAATNTIFSQGSMLSSENPTDFAIDGEGFFAVQGDDGETYYTRNGAFCWAIGPQGTTLCNSDGYPVLDSNGNQIIVPAGVTSGNMVISNDGSIGYRTAAGAYVAMNQTIGLHQFTNPAGLEKLSRSLYAVSDASGAAMNEATTAGLNRSTVNQYYLEGSNVQIADEMVNLIVAQRAYELNSKAIQASDDMLQQANNLRR
ncbi:MAG: flagellar basal-body rod protein FlgG [Lachnospiraceae bacterium]|nr:flagellar basal-body rod protein FlgG [Lachnospiraceae bacterium]